MGASGCTLRAGSSNQPGSRATMPAPVCKHSLSPGITAAQEATHIRHTAAVAAAAAQRPTDRQPQVNWSRRWAVAHGVVARLFCAAPASAQAAAASLCVVSSPPYALLVYSLHHRAPPPHRCARSAAPRRCTNSSSCASANQTARPCSRCLSSTTSTTSTLTQTMPPSKRSRRSSALDADSLLAIRLAEGAPLAADRQLLQVASDCARGLPADAAAWDLSGLLVDGQPVRREVVLAWLHAATQNTFKQPFSEPQQDPPLATSAAGLAQLLTFADAVGSVDSVLEACLPQPLEQLRFRVAAGGGQEVELEARGAYFWHPRLPLQLQTQAPGGEFRGVNVATLPSEEAKAALVQQCVSQLQVLPFLAHRLELDSLVALLHRCLSCNTAWPNSLLWQAASIIDPRVMSTRVLDAAVGPQAGQQAQAAFINSIITLPCTFVSFEGAPCQLFEPLNLTDEQKQPIVFDAVLARDLMGGSRGQRVEVKLDLFGKSWMRVGASPHVVQLLVGQTLVDATFQALKAAHAAGENCDELASCCSGCVVGGAVVAHELKPPCNLPTFLGSATASLHTRHWHGQRRQQPLTRSTAGSRGQMATACRRTSVIVRAQFCAARAFAGELSHAQRLE